MLELEVKFYIADEGSIRKRLEALGATSQGRHFEINLCFEDAQKTFKRRDMLLRLRKERQAILTFKAPPETADTDVKAYRELEVTVGDFDTCMAILQALGFSPERRYEKWRETFHLEDTHVLIDTTPYGTFLEIEGDKSHIVAVAEQLGLKWQERILLNYLAIFDIIRREEGLSFRDMTFDNFNTVSCQVESYLSSMVAG